MVPSGLLTLRDCLEEYGYGVACQQGIDTVDDLHRCCVGVTRSLYLDTVPPDVYKLAPPCLNVTLFCFVFRVRFGIGVVLRVRPMRVAPG